MKIENRKQNERAIWDQIADGYDARSLENFKEAYSRTHSAVLEEIKAESTILEIGCGTGLISMAIAPHSGKFFGVDLSPNMLTQAEEKVRHQDIPQAAFQLADAYQLPFKDESFDVALITNLLHIVAEPTSVLGEAHRVLRPGGLLVTVTDCLAEPGPIKVRLYTGGLRLMKLFGRVKYYHFYRRFDLQDLLTTYGFSIRKEVVLQKIPVNYYLSGIKEV